MDNANKTDYRIVDHTADLGLEIFGDDPAKLFKNAAHALFGMLVQAQPGHCPAGRRHRFIEIQGEDWPDLMFNWLRELLYLFNGCHQILLDLRVEYISDKGLEAVVTTDDFSPGRHRVEREIKAVTYHQLEVAPHGRRWRAKIIFDI